MVQVDVFWTYGLGASFGVAAHRQIHEVMSKPTSSPFLTPYYIRLLLFLSLLFVPSSICTFWGFPSWQTMHVGGRAMSAWLVSGLLAADVLLAILGFWVACRLVQRDRLYPAFLHWSAAYFLMFFTIAYGWDGTGYRRYFSITREDFLHWSSGNVSTWLNSDLATTVSVFTLIMVPLLFYWLSSWLEAGYRAEAEAVQDTAHSPGRLRIAGWIALLVFGAALGGALLANLLLRLLGPLAGLAVVLLAGAAAAIPRAAPLRFLFRRVTLTAPR